MIQMPFGSARDTDRVNSSQLPGSFSPLLARFKLLEIKQDINKLRRFNKSANFGGGFAESRIRTSILSMYIRKTSG